MSNKTIPAATRAAIFFLLIIADALRTRGSPGSWRLYKQTTTKPIVGEKVRRERRWASAGATPARELPDKRRSRLWWTFSTPRLGQFFQKSGFSTDIACSRQLTSGKQHSETTD